MLHKITIENFFSISEEQELNFKVPANAPDLACFKPTLSNTELRLPAVIGFFGPNASGKTTILRAVISALLFVRNSFDKGIPHPLFTPYRQKNWWEKPTKIMIEFDGKLDEESPYNVFRYELHIGHKSEPMDFSGKTVVYEALSYAPAGKFRSLFKREGQNISFGREFGVFHANDPRTESIRPDAGVISTLAKLNHPLSIYLKDMMGRAQTNIIGVENIQPNAMQSLQIYHQHPDCLAGLNKELRRLDLGLSNMEVVPVSGGFIAKLYHEGLDEFVFLEEESQGTKGFINNFPRLYAALKTGTIAIIDEIDTDLHPMLLPELFRWFADSKRNPKGAQLLFTAHNPGLLDHLEKEQVYFTEKPSGRGTSVYGGKDIQGLRREPSLMKKYLSGELGAVPHIG